MEDVCGNKSFCTLCFENNPECVSIRGANERKVKRVVKKGKEISFFIDKIPDCIVNNENYKIIVDGTYGDCKDQLLYRFFKYCFIPDDIIVNIMGDIILNVEQFERRGHYVWELRYITLFNKT